MLSLLFGLMFVTLLGGLGFLCCCSPMVLTHVHKTNQARSETNDRSLRLCAASKVAFTGPVFPVYSLMDRVPTALSGILSDLRARCGCLERSLAMEGESCIRFKSMLGSMFHVVQIIALKNGDVAVYTPIPGWGVIGIKHWCLVDKCVIIT